MNAMSPLTPTGATGTTGSLQRTTEASGGPVVATPQDNVGSTPQTRAEVTYADLTEAMAALRNQPPDQRVSVGENTGVTAWNDGDGTVVVSRAGEKGRGLEVEIQEGSPAEVLQRAAQALRQPLGEEVYLIAMAPGGMHVHFDLSGPMAAPQQPQQPAGRYQNLNLTALQDTSGMDHGIEFRFFDQR